MPSNLNASVFTMAHACTKVSREVTTELIAVLKGLIPPKEMFPVKVCLMGSRYYGLASPTSDSDLAIAFAKGAGDPALVVSSTCASRTHVLKGY